MVTFYKREPASEQMMKDCRLTQPGSICNVLARIYFSKDKEQAKYDCRLAVTIAKAMSKRLSEYQNKHGN